ncbi:hypothetical protein HQ308_14740 [Rhodococcus sp. BP-241]|uniref:hypothetical protein n=1 Tax=Rhodococcus sp. BP-241 TaxID=2739441 RepID=UPI001C9AC54D|nr:hypothetical protein [Rhodococcus sp. BP-241]MBY6708060.1 hypothetical protein [Rhodococcus sp. BP-241]
MTQELGTCDATGCGRPASTRIASTDGVIAIGGIELLPKPDGRRITYTQYTDLCEAHTPKDVTPE